MGGIKGNNKAASGFREFMKEQRKIHALSGSKCEPKIEIRLSSNQKQHQNMETMIIEPQLTIVCAKTDDESNIAKAPLADLTGCSKWIYDIFQTSTFKLLTLRYLKTSVSNQSFQRPKRSMERRAFLRN